MIDFRQHELATGAFTRHSLHVNLIAVAHLNKRVIHSYIAAWKVEPLLTLSSSGT